VQEQSRKTVTEDTEGVSGYPMAALMVASIGLNLTSGDDKTLSQRLWRYGPCNKSLHPNSPFDPMINPSPPGESGELKRCTGLAGIVASNFWAERTCYVAHAAADSEPTL